jgi:hypothetical protein
MASALEIMYDFEMEGVPEVQTAQIDERSLLNINSSTMFSLLKRNFVRKIRTRDSSKAFDKISREPIPYNKDTKKYEIPDLNNVYWIPVHKHYWRITYEGMNYVDTILKPGFYKDLGSKIMMDKFIDGIAFDATLPFGIELEFTKSNFVSIPEKERDNNWLPEANRLAIAIKRITGKNPKISKQYISSSIHEWTVKYDSSCGWEVTSPKYKGSNDLIECLSVVQSIEDEIKKGLDLLVNESTGFHLHLELRIMNINELKNLIRYIRYYEPSYYSLINPNRMNNKYCKPFRTSFSKNLLKKITSIEKFRQIFNQTKNLNHHISINFEKFAGPERSTVEIRLHEGTYKWDKILHWISLWMGIIRNGKYINKENVNDEIDYPVFTNSGDIMEVVRDVKLLNKNEEWLKKRRLRQLKKWYKEGYLMEENYITGINNWYGS